VPLSAKLKSGTPFWAFPKNKRLENKQRKNTFIKDDFGKFKQGKTCFDCVLGECFLERQKLVGGSFKNLKLKITHPFIPSREGKLCGTSRFFFAHFAIKTRRETTLIFLN
jgi:hypothetical protein